MELESIKWPADFSELQSMDSAFKCGICYDYMKTSMITLCSHTYCSLCIRKFLQYSTKCPTCFVETHENELRNNRPLDDIIMLYLEVRNKLLKALRVAEAASRGTVAASPAPTNSNPSSQPTGSFIVTPKSGIKPFVMSSTRNSSEKTPTARSRLFSPESPSTHVDDDMPESLECKVPLMFTASKPCSSVPSKTKVPVEKAQCPVCQVEIPQRNINIHLDACLDRSKSIPKETPMVNIKKRDPLPKRLHHMMTDRILKQELKSHGLNVQGDRKAWLNRIRRFMVLYNSETDVDNPRPVSIIIQQVEREEREEKRKENTLFKSLSQKVDRYSNPDVITKANKQYIEDNKDSFTKMIEEMQSREGRNIKPTKPINVLESDEEEDSLRVVGGRNVVDLEVPSTSSASAVSTNHTATLSDKQDSGNSQHSIPEEAATEPKAISPKRPEFISESSVDSVFDFATTKNVLSSSSRKKLVKRKTLRNRTPSPDPFNETSSIISEHCNPDTNLYQSIFGDDEHSEEEICRSGNSVVNEMESPSFDKSAINLDLGSSPIESESHLTPVRTRPKRKQPSKPLTEEIESLATRRPRRNAKKPKQST